jgi:hypothetical protein
MLIIYVDITIEYFESIHLFLVVVKIIVVRPLFAKHPSVL